MRRTLKIVAVMALAAATSASAGGRGTVPEVVQLQRPAAPEWFGVYLMGKKAGFSSVWVGLESRDGRKVLVARSTSTLSVTVGGRNVQRTQDEEKVYEARPGGRLSR